MGLAYFTNDQQTGFYNCIDQMCDQLIGWYDDATMFRMLATLAFAVSLDVILFDGKYTHAVEQVQIKSFNIGPIRPPQLAVPLRVGNHNAPTV